MTKTTHPINEFQLRQQLPDNYSIAKDKHNDIIERAPVISIRL